MDSDQPAVSLPLSSAPGACPSCGSGDLMADNFEVLDNHQVHQVVHCQHCGAKWSDRYVHADTLILKGPE